MAEFNVFYPLSPPQHGMLFHSLASGTSMRPRARRIVFERRGGNPAAE